MGASEETGEVFASSRRQLKRPMSRRPWRWTLVVLAAAAYAAYAAVASEQGSVPLPEAAARCAVCHEEQANAWAASVHRRTVGAPHIAAQRQGCGACHQALSEHIEDPSKVPTLVLGGIGPITGERVIELCLSCHKDAAQIMFRASAHAKLPQACLSCHHPHQGAGREMLRAPQPELCDQCHPQQAAEMHLPSHHPIPEGKMTCTDCHNVHGDQRNNLPAESNSEMCYRCHAEKAGPFLYEHPPVTEDCAICHKPHGAQNDRLLRVDQPMLCLQCHPGHHASRRTPLVALGTDEAARDQALNAIAGFYTRCTSCHTRIHGTDLPTGTNAAGTNQGNFMPGRPPASGLPLGSASALNSGPFWGLTGLAALGLEGAAAGWGFSDLELGSIDENGNPAYVREYDGARYEFTRARFAGDHYSARSDFHVQASNPGANDEEVEAYFGTPTVGAKVKYSALTHRQPRFDDITGPVQFPGIRGSIYDLEITDLSQGDRDLALRRKVSDLDLAARLPQLSNVRWLARYWRESENGRQHFLFLDRTNCHACHKLQTVEPINRVTTEAVAGAELAWERGALRYLHSEGRFENRAPEQEFDFGAGSGPRIFEGLAPLFGVSEHRSRSDEVRAMALPTPTLALSALWRQRDRDNVFNGFGLGVDSVGGSLAWGVAPHLRLAASMFATDFDNSVALADPTSGEVALDGISRDRRSSRVELRYSGVPGTTLSAGFTRDEVDRFTLFSKVPQSSDTDTWNLSAIARLPRGGSLNLRYRNSSTDHRQGPRLPGPPEDFSRWIGLPTDEDLFSAVATYTLGRGLLGSLLYSQAHRSFEIRDVAARVLRHAHDDTTTAGAEVFWREGKRSQLAAGFHWQEGDARSDVTYGISDFSLDPPLAPGDVSIIFPRIQALATFDYDARILRLDGWHWLTPRLRLFGRFERTASDGSVIANDLGDYLDQEPDLDGLALTLNPFDITLDDRWLGVGYLVDPFTEVTLSFQRREWDNARDAAQNGSFDLWRVGVRKKF